MVKLVSSLALSALIIAPAFAFRLPDFEMLGLKDFLSSSFLIITYSRDVSEPHLLARELSEYEAAVFARDMEGLFARQQQDPQYADLARRHFHFSLGKLGKLAKGAVGM
jgi:hypothetical protein